MILPLFSDLSVGIQRGKKKLKEKRKEGHFLLCSPFISLTRSPFLPRSSHYLRLGWKREKKE